MPASGSFTELSGLVAGGEVAALELEGERVTARLADGAAVAAVVTSDAARNALVERAHVAGQVRRLGGEATDLGGQRLLLLLARVDVALGRVSLGAQRGLGLGVDRDLRGERGQLHDWAARKGEAGLADYRRKNNATSLDGLPALRGT